MFLQKNRDQLNERFNWSLVLRGGLLRKSATNLRDCNIIRFKIGPFKENETWTWKRAAGEGSGGKQLARKCDWGQTYTIDICYKLEISRIAIRLF